MKLKDIMSRNVEAISAQASLVEAASRMARHDIGFLPVVDGDITGVVTDRDIVIRAIAEGRDPSSTRVGDVLTKQVESLREEQDVKEAAQLMQDKQVRRLLVKDDKGAYVGVVSLGDLAAEGGDPQLSGVALEQVCKS